MKRKAFRFFSGQMALVVALIAMILSPRAGAAEAQALAVKKISADVSQQLIVEFSGGTFPESPQLLDLPGPNHRVVIDFGNASIDRSSLLSQTDLSRLICQSLPFVKAVRYTELENAPKPTARLVVDLPEELRIKPRVVKLEAGVAVIAFSDQPISIKTPDLTVAGTPEQANAVGNAVASDPPTPVPAQAGAPSAEEQLRPAISQAETTPVVETPAAKDTVAESNVSAGSEVNAASLATQSALNDVASGKSASASPAASSLSTKNPPMDTAAAKNKLEAVKCYNRAVQLHLGGKLSEAIAVYREALKSNDELAEAHSNLGLIFNQQHNYAEALVEFRKALAINPKDAITYNGVGAALRAERDLLGAIKNWQTAVSLDPKLATAHYNLGTAYELQKDYDRSLASYRAAVKNDYRLGEAYYRMGLIMVRKHRSEDAAEHFKEALKISADSEYSEDARQRLAYLQNGGKKGKE